MSIIPNVQKKPPYDPLKDFEPISLLAQAPLLVVVHPSLPVKSMKDLVALAKDAAEDFPGLTVADEAGAESAGSTFIQLLLPGDLVGLAGVFSVPASGKGFSCSGATSGAIGSVLVVGGGRIAHRKVQQLLMADADVTVLAPSIIDELRALRAEPIDRAPRVARYCLGELGI